MLKALGVIFILLLFSFAGLYLGIWCIYNDLRTKATYQEWKQIKEIYERTKED